jgi:hypothetical protein
VAVPRERQRFAPPQVARNNWPLFPGKTTETTRCSVRNEVTATSAVTLHEKRGKSTHIAAAGAAAAGEDRTRGRLGCVSLPGQVGDRCNCEFWPSRVPTYPHSQLAARSAAIPTYPPSGAEFRERPPSGRAQRHLPTLARCLPAPRPYLPTLAQVFPIAAVTYLPGQRDATLGCCTNCCSMIICTDCISGRRGRGKSCIVH